MGALGMLSKGMGIVGKKIGYTNPLEGKMGKAMSLFSVGSGINTLKTDKAMGQSGLKNITTSKGKLFL